ncbi:glycoside hydrolase family 16 protein [Symbioplanes lichenis]|uniref:glycoside hydrolase family 16 protein n=1 Tax=Symbioplanes lichenis TaxID=1629072 RepID=UPI00273864B7|nr:glycoside hydrolase family 16 protein [Actinoplanes lichenis]
MEDTFAGDELDTELWLPHYLPHWSSRAASAATCAVADGKLRLSIPPEQGLWCEGLHPEPLRVSGVQSACVSGPVGSAIGGQPFKEGLLVTAEEPGFWGHTPLYGRIEARLRAILSPRSMAAFWLAGVEDKPQHSGELCVMEVFGSSVREATCEVGVGLHSFRDPGLTEDWVADRQPLDPADFHVYAVDWQPGTATFTIDGRVVKRIGQSPNYPMQLMLAVFDFPQRGPAGPTPELIVDHVRTS